MPDQPDRVDLRWELPGRAGTSCWASTDMARHYADSVDHDDRKHGLHRTWEFKPCQHTTKESPR